MDNHITNRSPTWRTRLLSLFGLTDLPVKVNCWYCNQNTFLLPGGKQTVQYWHCNICENNNVKDENGDVVDTDPCMYDSSRNQPVAPVQDTARTFQTRRLCDSCERNQAIIYQIMSDYIRDESDPEYDYYIRTADDYKASLHQKYPLCDDCQAKVDQIVAEQRAALRQHRFNEKLTRSVATKAPKKPSNFDYRIKGVLWIWTHSMTLLICLYAYWYPPIRREDATMAADARQMWSSFEESLVGLSGSLHADDITCAKIVKDALMLGIQSTWTVAQYLHQATLCFVAPERSESCQWDYSDHAMLFTAVSLLSFCWMDWHPKASKTYFEESRVKYWPLYKVTQRILYFARLGLLAILGYANDSILHKATGYALCFIPLALVVSVLAVKVAGQEWRNTAKIDALQGLKRRYADIQRFATDKVTKIGKENREAAIYDKPSQATPLSQDFAEDEQEKEIIAAMWRKRSQYKLPVPDAYRDHHASNSAEQQDDGDMEGIVTGIHKIAFDGIIF